MKLLLKQLERLSFDHRTAVHDLTWFVAQSSSGIADDVKTWKQYNKRLLDEGAKELVAAKYKKMPGVVGDKQAKVRKAAMATEEQWLKGAIEKSIERSRIMAVGFPATLFRMALIYRIALYDAFLDDLYRTLVVAAVDVPKERQLKPAERKPDGGPENLKTKLNKELRVFSFASRSKKPHLLEKRFGLSSASLLSESMALKILSARRNLLVHANGIVDDHYASHVEPGRFNSGDVFLVEEAYWKASNRLLTKIADRLLKKVVDMFLPHGNEDISLMMTEPEPLPLRKIAMKRARSAPKTRAC